MTFLTKAAGHVISSDMVSVFHSTDTALMASARATASLLEGTAQSGLHPRAKQKLLESMNAGVAKMLEGRREMVSAHAQMVVIHRQSNIAPVGFGCWGAPNASLVRTSPAQSPLADPTYPKPEA